MNMGVVQIDEKVILNWLKMEAGSLMGANMEGEGRLLLVISHPEFPEVHFGGQIPTVRPTYTTIDGETRRNRITEEDIFWSEEQRIVPVEEEEKQEPQILGLPLDIPHPNLDDLQAS